MSSTKNHEGKVTLNQMLRVLDKDLATGIEKKLKKLSKKKAIKAPIDKNKADQIERKVGYSKVSKDLEQWDSIIQDRKKAKQIRFPLDQEPDYLPTTAESLNQLEAKNEFEKQVQSIVNNSDSVLHDKKELSKAEEKYLKAISIEEAQERHKELQRMRVLLSSYAAKMRRQKAIKSKSYHRLLKHERIKRHVKKVESNKDMLLDEIDRLQKLRAQERASLKHKNTGKWAKHAKFRAKYDDEARKAMLEQIGIAEKLLEKAAPVESDTDDEEDEDVISVESESEDDTDNELEVNKMENKNNNNNKESLNDTQLNVKNKTIQSVEPPLNRLAKYKSLLSGNRDDNNDGDDMDDDDEDEQRKLMSEAFADDDVVAEFQKAKEQIAGEEQPKDVDLFLPGWGNWGGPGTKVSKKKRQKYIIKAKKLPRKDDNLGNVIISEQADEKSKELMVQKLPRSIKNREQFDNILSRPLVGTFTPQLKHRELIKPRVHSKLGARIEPMNKKILSANNKAKWAR